ncbi:MFS transporter [Williamsia muralis]|uniref:MFS transporter n=1 Tax=Williamsia marianensis TaxID=85044 RepID=UPI000DE77F03|nr:MFS transporter [Williamsia marianensis]PVY28442.1 sugar transport protein [Williamsia marianensis]
MTATDRDGRPTTVQQYIDEVPAWRDGTPATAGAMTSMQKRIWLLASAGKFFEGMIVFMVGVALPLITAEFDLTSAQAGLTTAAPLLGIMIGASALGGLSDRWGRRQMFLAEMALFTVFLVGVTVSPGYGSLVVCLIGMGLALGCDYPTAHTMISETMPTSVRGRGVLAAFGFQAVGALAGTLVGVLILGNRDELSDWRWMFAVVVIPSLLVMVGRLFIVQSPHWLLHIGRVEEAEAELQRLLTREPVYPATVSLDRSDPATAAPSGAGVGMLLRAPWRRSTILASVPWFLQDLGTYGIGIFTPTVIAATVGTATANESTVTAVVDNDLQGTEGAVMIDAFLLIGIVLAVILVDRFGRIRLQIFGFLGCAVGLLIAALSTVMTGTLQIVLVFAGFMLFNLMTNLGPNSMTYLLAGEVFPTHLRGTGAGMAASVAKVGAVLTAFLFPILLEEWGTAIIVLILAGTSLLGALITWRFRVETTGISLEQVDRMHDPSPPAGSPSLPLTSNRS